MLVFKMQDNGGFAAGDTETLRTSYAYPSSPHATAAKAKPSQTARAMIEQANDHIGTLPAPLLLDYDRRIWELLA